jgi:hypothetical protein
MNPVSQLSERGDLILTSPGFSTTGAAVSGHSSVGIKRQILSTSHRATIGRANSRIKR